MMNTVASVDIPEESTPSEQCSAMTQDAEAGKPLGRMTAFAFFLQISQEHRKESPDEPLIFDDVGIGCVRLWKLMPAKEKKPFHEMAEKDKERYELEKQKYEASICQLDIKRRPIKDPNVPKRPLAAFFWFGHAERAKVKRDNPELGFMEIQAELTRIWADMDPEVKQKYILMAEQDNARYEKEMAEYNISMKMSTCKVSPQV